MITISNPTKYIAGLYVRLSNEKIEEVTNTIEALTFIFNKYINGDDK